MIESAIGRQQFELIHDQIGAILRSEIDNQYILSYDSDLLDQRGDLISIWKERDIPFNDSEIPAINICFDRAEFDMRTLVQHDGIYRYLIEIQSQGETQNDNTLGDTIAMTRVQKIMGLCRAILMNPEYVIMGFVPGLIKRRYVENMFFGKPIRQDSSHTCMGRMTLVVEAVETSPFNEGMLAQGITTSVRLYNTDSGYKYVSYYYI